MITRRQFHAAATSAVLGSVALGSGNARTAGVPKDRAFTLDLRCGSIGVNANQLQAIELAHKHGFESLTPEPGFLAQLDDSKRKALADDMKQKKLVWGSAGLPVEFRRDEARFRDGLKNFPKQAAGLQKAGVTRMGTWIMPKHDTLTYMANFRQHAKRLRECVKVMADHGLRFGIEYVGPKTLWTSGRYSFVHSMVEARELLDAIGMKNTGLVLDSWHWYTAHETLDDLKTLKNSDIVACDLNDAPKGVPIDKQIDNRRELPSATGVIDLRGFLSALVEIGYDGPIRAEPFNQPLNKLDNDAACAATAKAMKTAFGLVQKRPDSP